MAEHQLADLLVGVDGWSVVAILTHEDLVEVRLGCQLDGGPSWASTRATLFESVPVPDGSSLLGERLMVAPGRVQVGGWEFGDDDIIAVQMLDFAVAVVDDGSHDAVGQPLSVANLVLETGRLLWPPDRDRVEKDAGLARFEGLTRIALLRPSLVASVSTKAAESTEWCIFTTPLGAVETERHPETSEPMLVSYFPVSDLPSRIMERTGIARWLTLGGPPAPAQVEVRVQTTFMDDADLVAGALSFQETFDGRLETLDGPMSTMAVASEILRMLPGGDLDLESVGKEVVTTG